MGKTTMMFHKFNATNPLTQAFATRYEDGSVIALTMINGAYFAYKGNALMPNGAGILGNYRDRKIEEEAA